MESNVSLRDLAHVSDRTLYKEPSDRIDPKYNTSKHTNQPKER